LIPLDPWRAARKNVGVPLLHGARIDQFMAAFSATSGVVGGAQNK
jgi:hypothetical protein